MNKIFLLIICTFTFSFYISPMDIVTADKLQPISADCHYDLKKKFLLELANNVHRYVEGNCQKQVTSASEIIFNISSVNKDLCNSLQALRTDPLIARPLLLHIINNFEYKEFFSLNSMPELFPAAKKCFELSQQLYDNDLTPEKITSLYQKGAILDCNIVQQDKHYQLLQYWLYHRTTLQETKEKILDKLLELGIQPNDIVYIIINHQKINCLKIALKHKAPIDKYCWSSLFYSNNPDKEQYLNVLLEHATQDELNLGLKECMGYTGNDYNPVRMKMLIKQQGDTNIALNYLVQTLDQIPHFYANNNFVKNLMFLCNNKAFDAKALGNLKKVRDLFNTCIEAVEKNQPS